MPGTPNEWIEYADGGMPPDPEATVVVKFRDALQGKARRAGLWRWTWEMPPATTISSPTRCCPGTEPMARLGGGVGLA